MTLVQHRGGGVIFLSFLVALGLAMVPLPEALAPARPHWLSLVLIYWTLALPERVGVGLGWLAGLSLDVAMGTVLGLNALALAVVAYLSLRLHQRIRVFPLWQQAASVLLLVTTQLLLVSWVHGVLGQPPHSPAYWLSALTSAALWPPLYLVLRGLRRRYQVR